MTDKPLTEAEKKLLELLELYNLDYGKIEIQVRGGKPRTANITKNIKLD